MPASIIVRSTRPLALVGAALFLAACSRQRGPIQIGLAGPLSDPRGVAMQHGAQLAVDEINAKGGVRGRLLQLRPLDDSASDDRATRVAQLLYDDPAVIAVIGHLTSGTSIAAGEVYGNGAHPLTMITPGTSSPDLTSLNPYAFTVFPSDSVHGAAMARFAWQTLVARRAGVLFAASDYGRGLRKAFVADFTKTGGVIVEADPYLPTTASLEPYLSRMRGAGIDVLVLAADEAAGEAALRQLDARGARWPVLGGEELAGIEGLGAPAVGVRIATAYLSDRPGERNAAFVTDFGRAYAGARPDYRSAGAYDVVYLLAQAIATVGPRRTAIRDYLARVGGDIPPFEGVTGRIGFDETRNVTSRGVVIGLVRDGHLVAEATQ
ncbi:MAG TPA: ABC transporter substrate-binding protein [Gemmatimonadales bacterium]|nr:ABC transporter substrate-binding protein [Gemmatimonadales bacterium]